MKKCKSSFGSRYIEIKSICDNNILFLVSIALISFIYIYTYFFWNSYLCALLCKVKYAYLLNNKNKDSQIHNSEARLQARRDSKVDIRNYPSIN